MKKVLVFGGTTEGRILAEILSNHKIDCQVCVATEYGNQVMDSSDLIYVREGRLSIEEMQALYEEEAFDVVVDATHPFATLVSENIRKSIALYDDMKNTKLPLLRFERQIATVDEEDNFFCFSDAKECAKALEHTEGNILLTTGSKDLQTFCQNENVRNRIIARVLPGLESIKLCYDAGLEGKQIIGQQGPFSENLNSVQISEYGIKVLVTKETGKVGGLDTKISAAKKAGIKCFVIRKPKTEMDACEMALGGYEKFYAISDICNRLSEILGVEILGADEKCVQSECRIFVSLVGIGMGNPETLTIEAERTIREADYIFGAKRMIESVSSDAAKYPYYLEKDIIPALAEIKKTKSGIQKVAVLFSGDTGFYSGAAKLSTALQKLDYVEHKMLPGISSIVALAAKVGIPWQDATIMSTHGIEENIWIPQMKEAAEEGKKIFFLTSGVEDIHKIGQILVGIDKEFTLYLGYQLSYENEKILTVKPSDCASVSMEGLYCGMCTVNRTDDEV